MKSGHDGCELSRSVSWANQPLGSRNERAGFILLLFLAIAVRIPKVWVEGRFWAEEGAVFFSKAWNTTWWEALLSPHANYLNLAGNIAGLLAVHLSTLPAAPYVSTTVAIVIQCLPGVLLVASHERWLQNRLVVLVALMVMVFAPVPEELWATSAASYNHLALCAALILALEIRTGVVGIIHGGLLLLAALSGPAPWVLVPLYALRAALDRSRPRALQGLALLAGATIQLVFFSSLGERDPGMSPSLFGAIVMAKHVLVPLLGHKLAVAPIAALLSEFQAGHGPLWPLLLVVILFSTVVTIAAFRPRAPSLWLLLASAALAGVGYLGAIDPKISLLHTFAGGRHAFAPQMLIGLALLSWTVVHAGRLRVMSGFVLGWIVLVGGYNYVVPTSTIFTTGPNWRLEVAHWRNDPERPLQIWPTGWSMRLSVK